MNMQLFILTFFLAGTVYAEEVNDQFQFLFPNQPISIPNTTSVTKQHIIGTNANGESQLALMDQNGHWNAPSESKIENTISTQPSTLSPNTPFPSSSRCFRSSSRCNKNR